MTRYLLRLQPMEPFFFGNERGLNFPGSKSQYQNLYFVRSENTPSQTTILGALRFLVLQANGRSADDFSEFTAAQKKLIGSEERWDSFQPEQREKQPFGVIHSISPVFLMEGSTVYIPAPMDHNTADDNAGGKYSPLRRYKAAASLDGPMLYAEDYDLKSGTVSGFVSLPDGQVLENGKLFSPVLRVGINRKQQGKDEGGFFKKEYKRLKDGFCFAVFCELDDGDWIRSIPPIACLGQGHSPFRVQLQPAEKDSLPLADQARAFMKAHHSFAIDSEEGRGSTMIYCLGDALMTSADPKDEEKDVYEGLLFGATESRDFRSLRTVLQNGRFTREKHSALYRLMKAGSVLIAPDAEAADRWIARFRHENASQIGFNAWITFPLTATEKEETK